MPARSVESTKGVRLRASSNCGLEMDIGGAFQGAAMARGSLTHRFWKSSGWKPRTAMKDFLHDSGCLSYRGLRSRETLPPEGKTSLEIVSPKIVSSKG